MGRELNLQSIPEDSELLEIAIQDLEVAELLSLVGYVFEGQNLFSRYKNDTSRVFDEKAQKISKKNPKSASVNFMILVDDMMQSITYYAKNAVLTSHLDSNIAQFMLLCMAINKYIPK